MNYFNIPMLRSFSKVFYLFIFFTITAHVFNKCAVVLFSVHICGMVCVYICVISIWRYTRNKCAWLVCIYRQHWFVSCFNNYVVCLFFSHLGLTKKKNALHMNVLKNIYPWKDLQSIHYKLAQARTNKTQLAKQQQLHTTKRRRFTHFSRCCSCCHSFKQYLCISRSPPIPGHSNLTGRFI